MGKSAPTFPYQYKRIEFGSIFNPYISIPVKAPWGWQNLWFLVDSGADTVMLTVSLANQLGLSFNQKRKTKLFGIGEKSVTAYPGKITLRLGDYIIKSRAYFIDAEDSILLLGRLDIFDRFNVVFDTRNQQVIFDRV